MLLQFAILFLVPAATVSGDVAEEVNGVLNRVLGTEKASLFAVTITPDISPNGKDTFRLYKAGGSGVHVTGSSGVAAAWGVRHYLTRYCDCHISWDGDQLNLPELLPDVNETITSLDQYKYYQNVCTTSYSFVWWDRSRWEREIDWMALNGINLALAFGGQEAIWRRVFDGLGVANDSFAGPAFLSWNRMGNMRGFGGGLSPAWHDRSVSLQHFVLERMRALGIKPVLPAFSGILPPSFQEKFPSAVGKNMTRWNSFSEEFCCPFLLSPSDPLFSVVSRLFLREYIAEFGTDHIYNSDTFNENNPDSNDPQYLADTARAIFDGMTEADPLAVWMLQGWMFLSPFWGLEQVKAYVTSVPIGKMLILDLQSDLTPFYDQFESYYGQPFIWCTLHNFGGQLGVYGHLQRVNEGIVHGRTFSANSTMVGIGITPEGIDQNYIMYDFTLEGSLQSETRNLSEYVSDYIRRRYGTTSPLVDEAWQILRETTYNFSQDRRVVKSKQSKWTARMGMLEPTPYGIHIAQNILTKFPTLSLTEISWYEKRKVYDAFLLMAEEAASPTSTVSGSPIFAHDLVDTTRQVVQLAVGLIYHRLVTQYRERDLASFNQTGILMLNILDDLDPVLRTDVKFLLGTWLEGAKAASTDEADRENFEWNARNQITLWGPNGELRDYAAKQWAGMIKDFYRPRWAVFMLALVADLTGATPYNRTAVEEIILSTVEIPFTKDRTSYPTQPDPNPIAAVLKFNGTWGNILPDIFGNEYIPTRHTVVGPTKSGGRSSLR